MKKFFAELMENMGCSEDDTECAGCLNIGCILLAMFWTYKERGLYTEDLYKLAECVLRYKEEEYESEDEMREDFGELFEYLGR